MRQINKTLYYPIWYNKTDVVVLQCNRQCHPAVDALSCHKRIINSVSFCIAFEPWARISYSEQSLVNLSENNVSATRIEFSANESWLVFMHSQMASTQCFFFCGLSVLCLQRRTDNHSTKKKNLSSFATKFCGHMVKIKDSVLNARNSKDCTANAINFILQC